MIWKYVYIIIWYKLVLKKIKKTLPTLHLWQILVFTLPIVSILKTIYIICGSFLQLLGVHSDNRGYLRIFWLIYVAHFDVQTGIWYLPQISQYVISVILFYISSQILYSHFRKLNLRKLKLNKIHLKRWNFDLKERMELTYAWMLDLCYFPYLLIIKLLS